MAFTVEYAGTCIQGLVRRNNEDNICCGDKYLPIIHTDDTAGLSGVFSSSAHKDFAVFDGMGGEKCGEIASHLAARTFAGFERSGPGFEADAARIAEEMNASISEYAKKNRIRNIGSTAVSLSFGREMVCGFNIGDSRCYRLTGGRLSMLSTDHVITGPSAYEGYLTQCLGYFGTGNPLETALYRAPLVEGDVFLLCTDGLTKTVSERRITSVLKERLILPDKLEKLKNIVLRRGAEDNATILLFEIHRKKKAFHGLFVTCLSWLAGY